jgi:hypothetical protein
MRTSRSTMHDSTPNGASTPGLTVVRLLQNPLGQEAPPGERGDMVRVSDGRARLYLLPSEFEVANAASLRWMLARQPGWKPAEAVTTS